MPMNGGDVTISGLGIASGTGLSKELYDALEEEFGVSPAEVPQNVPGAQEQLAKMARRIAQVVVDHIVSNGVVTVASGIPVSTTGSASAQSGATTATGTGTIA